ncbi:MAG: hypothetical protein LBU98_05630 [Alistipes sp.]|jgi:hypothetical protein|nr:hypothetical protein [Alistipes sp.]
MKLTNRLTAALLVVLGFSSCEPEDDDYVPGRCDPNVIRPLYGTIPCEYETKAAASQWMEPSGGADLFIEETTDSENE